jgi:hypothetical protein
MNYGYNRKFYDETYLCGTAAGGFLSAISLLVFSACRGKADYPYRYQYGQGLFVHHPYRIGDGRGQGRPGVLHKLGKGLGGLHKSLRGNHYRRRIVLIFALIGALAGMYCAGKKEF